MNKSLLLSMAAIYAAGIDRLYDDGVLRRPRPDEPRFVESKPLREYTYKGHKVMAYSKDDARNRLRKEGKI